MRQRASAAAVCLKYEHCSVSWSSQSTQNVATLRAGVVTLSERVWPEPEDSSPGNCSLGLQPRLRVQTVLHQSGSASSGGTSKA